MMVVYVGADHAGFELKEAIRTYLEEEGYEVEDVGNTSYEPGDDYPDFGHTLATRVASGNAKGIICCGSSGGACIVANKVRGVRAISIYNSELARKAREDDDANVACLSGWYVDIDDAKKIVSTFLETPFSNEERHARRVNKIRTIEEEEGMRTH